MKPPSLHILIAAVGVAFSFTAAAQTAATGSAQAFPT
ncbi:MAG: hypothetical protein JWO70_3425, partial [Betaproteobacteria bacterium]|nr:hypothetical protein [Betaproteobacteria bacterium]